MPWGDLEQGGGWERPEGCLERCCMGTIEGLPFFNRVPTVCQFLFWRVPAKTASVRGLMEFIEGNGNPIQP